MVRDQTIEGRYGSDKQDWVTFRRKGAGQAAL